MAVKLNVKGIKRYFESLEDPRDTRNRKHLLEDIVVIAVCGALVGGGGPTEIAAWARHHQEWLQSFLELPNGIPSRDCLRRVLSLIKPAALQKCFHEWIALCTVVEDESTTSQQRHIAFDGKTLRRSHEQAAGWGPLHVVSAWNTADGVILGQLATEEKSNEITAIPQLLDELDVRGAVVTIDAMGCQTEIAQTIIDGQGDYVLAVKGNQRTLHKTIREFFAAEMENELADVPHRRHETHDAGHGRVEDRYYHLAPVAKDSPLHKRWPKLKAIGMATRVTEHADGRSTDEVRFYITSRYLSGKNFARTVRRHWAIENELHWVLDMNLREDESRTRNRILANNLAWLRRFAVSLVKQHPQRTSLRMKMRCCNWSTSFLTEVLTGTTT